MTEETAVPSAPEPSGEQTQVPPQQADWEARYKGLVKKVEELTLSNRTFGEQLSAKTSELEQLRATLTVKDTEKSAAVSERDRMLQTVTQQKTALESELAELRGLKLKIEVIREMGRPELLKIADRIPALTDKEALKTVLTDFAGFADEMVKQRESQLLAGVTPPPSNVGNARVGLPGSETEWEQRINTLPLGSKERAKAFDDYYAWLEQKHNPTR